jgi:hypothetical protein
MSSSHDVLYRTTQLPFLVIVPGIVAYALAGCVLLIRRARMNTDDGESSIVAPRMEGVNVTSQCLPNIKHPSNLLPRLTSVRNDMVDQMSTGSMREVNVVLEWKLYGLNAKPKVVGEVI